MTIIILNALYGWSHLKNLYVSMNVYVYVKECLMKVELYNVYYFVIHFFI